MSEVGKRTVFLTGHWLEDQGFGDYDKAAKLLQGARLYSHTSSPGSLSYPAVEGTTGLGHLSEDEFIKFVKGVVSSHGKGGLIQFTHAGHSGPRLSLFGPFGRSWNADKLTNIFFDSKKEDRPFLALILGGCYTGSIAKDLVEAGHIPDILFASPVHSVAYPLWKYFQPSCDMNGDGGITHYEQGVCDMSRGSNSMSTLVTAPGAPDLNIDGTPAKEPYFEKTARILQGGSTWSAHSSLLSELHALKYGERMFVLVRGEERDPKLEKLFQNQAENGSGRYKHVIVPDNSQTREFFHLEGESGLFVMSRNLRYEGVTVKPYESLEGQLPKILVNENPLLAVSSWKSKYSWSTHYDGGLAKGIQTTSRSYDRSVNIVNEVQTFLASGAPRDRVAGLQLLQGTIRGGIVSFDVAYELNQQEYDKVFSKGEIPSAKVLQLLATNLALLHSERFFVGEGTPLIGLPLKKLRKALHKPRREEIHKDLTELLNSAYHWYGRDFANAFFNGPFYSLSQEFSGSTIEGWRSDVSNGGTRLRERALVALALTHRSASEETSLNASVMALYEDHPGNKSLRKAAALYLWRAGKVKLPENAEFWE